MKRLVLSLALLSLASCNQRANVYVKDGELHCIECVPNNAPPTTDKNCDYSTDPDSFHTEGDYGNGLHWMVASTSGEDWRGPRYYFIVYGLGRSKYVELNNYSEAQVYTGLMFKAGYGCK